MNLNASPVLKGLIVVLLAVVIFYGFNRYIYAPNKETIRERQVELGRLSTTLLHVRETVENLPKVKAEYEALQEEWQRLEILVPQREEVTDLIQEISQAEKKAGLYIISIEPQASVPKELFTENPYRLEIEGSYHSFARFVSALSKLERIINVSQVQLYANPTALDEHDAVVVRCMLTSYTSLRRSG
ncbi:MAG: type 4a pilus biogenesis protein PilO [Gemmatimonadota bacterium]|nr:MAG: type 4a pilus biogenesis protein PilO [Gemmatimonadota bacterium]